MAVIAAVAAAHHARGVAAEVPREAGARPEVVSIAALRDVDVGNLDRKNRRVEIFVATAVQSLVPHSEVDRQVRTQFPVVLHERDAVLRRPVRVDRRKACAERRGAREIRDRGWIARVERLIFREREGAQDIAGVLLAVRHVVVLAAELDVVRRARDPVCVSEFPAALRAQLVIRRQRP